MALGTAHDRVDAGDQLIAVEGFGDIVVGPETKCADLGIQLACAGEIQHRRSDRVAAELLQHVVAVHVGQVQIEADDVVIVELAEVQALFAQIGGVDVEAFGRQHQFDALGRRRLVLNQQHTHRFTPRSEEHTSELQSLMRISYAVFCLKKKKKKKKPTLRTVNNITTYN